MHTILSKFVHFFAQKFKNTIFDLNKKQGASVNSADVKHGNTALHHAAEGGLFLILICFNKNIKTKMKKHF